MGLVDAVIKSSEPSSDVVGTLLKREKAELGMSSSTRNRFFEDTASLSVASQEEKQLEEAKPEVDKEQEDNLKFVRFRKWMEDNGCIFPNLVLKKYSSNYRGVHVSSPGSVVSEGSVILHIPHAMLITVELAKVNELC